MYFSTLTLGEAIYDTVWYCSPVLHSPNPESSGLKGKEDWLVLQIFICVCACVYKYIYTRIYATRNEIEQTILFNMNKYLEINLTTPKFQDCIPNVTAHHLSKLKRL